MKLLRKILIPFVPVYYFITWLRNKLYDWGIKKSVSYDFPVICVGNLSAGGTGKTPMIEYLVNLLKRDYKLATLSRGYKRKTQGFQLANETSTSKTIGDEPFQFYNKFKNEIYVAVDSDRKNGIDELKRLDKNIDIILLDDAYQHRKVKAGLNILLTTYQSLYFKDIMLPTGNLREPIRGAERANVIVVTKCPNNLSELQKKVISQKIKAVNHEQIYFSSINYSEKIISELNTKSIDDLKDFTLVTGIANSDPLVAFLKSKSLKFEHFNFKDHYDFTEKDIDLLTKKDFILTTEKDFMRLKQYETLKEKLFYLPITVKIYDAEKFNNAIIKFVKR
ncbi:tetraacyldisaccharide 4'-kinase [Litoribaculum gwangyangense]|uniref:Tetraacyldisaccharide 4'-kinase n=1 Tax=Litoribaculum gwangyangense TaxID=1130722 RepID=A0ABP9CMF3_9FLAO